MKRFELAMDGECSVGKFSSVFVNAVEYEDKDFIFQVMKHNTHKKQQK